MKDYYFSEDQYSGDIIPAQDGGYVAIGNVIIGCRAGITYIPAIYKGQTYSASV